MSFTLLVSDISLCVKNYEIVAAFSGAKLAIRSGASSEELVALDPTAKGLLLQTPAGEYVSQQHDMFRALANHSTTTSSTLFGENEEDAAHVDHWLDVSFQCHENIYRQEGMNIALPILEAQLAGRTFLVGERISAADVSVYTALSAAVNKRIAGNTCCL